VTFGGKKLWRLEFMLINADVANSFAFVGSCEDFEIRDLRELELSD